MFPQKLRELRKEKRLTAKQFGEKFTLAESTISGYETGARTPDMETIEKFANFFEVSVDYLMGRTDARSTTSKSGSNHNVDPEIIELLDKLQKKGAALEATAILRTASKMNKEQLKDILKVFEMIETEKKDGN
ncbi:helix-turn-helix domain-containing protein [Cohnella herbarum]|uniref:helix-turn-helix domain-containing protein n=1 Tax=Cohnella herbarum TaxID=2728023 RepID=UPI0020C30029|nr:helix-turn-helix transcriptional regulator [Cohnella herbarum]